MLEKVHYLFGVPHDRDFLSHKCEVCTGVYWKGCHEERNTHTGTFYKINTPWLFREEKIFGELDPSVTTQPRMGAPSSRGGSQVGIPQDQELKVKKDHLNPQYG